MTPQEKDQQQKAWNAYEKGFTRAAAQDWQNALPLFAQALSLHGNNVRYALFLGAALWHTKAQQAALQLWSLAADHDAMLRLAQYQSQADALTRNTSQLADTELRRFLTDLQIHAIKASKDPGRIRTAYWPQTHYGDIKYRENGCRPYMFHAPDLPETPIFDRSNVAWTQVLEASVPVIRDEYLQLIQIASERASIGQPYVGARSNAGQEWQDLRGSLNWTSIHLYKDGLPQSEARHCPQTCAALSELPAVLHNDNPMEAFFSVLKPGTHIPPHFGLANCRLTVHLPLIIPDTCAIRVSGTEHHWIEGETFLFDDSFDHEAWNKSDQTRVVLIFEAWRPDMTHGEIEAVLNSYKMRGDWTANRKVVDLQPLIDAT